MTPPPDLSYRTPPNLTEDEANTRFCYVALFRCVLEGDAWTAIKPYCNMHVLIERGHVEVKGQWVKLNEAGSRYWAREIEIHASIHQKQNNSLKAMLVAIRQRMLV